MTPQELFKTIINRIDDIAQQTAVGKQLLSQCSTIHPADIAACLDDVSHEDFDIIFPQFNEDLQLYIFEYLPISLRAKALCLVSDRQKLIFLEHMTMDDISDLVDFASDTELKNYFNLLHKKDREKVINLLKLKPNSVGTVMDINVVSLHQNFSVKKSIEILQRLSPEQALHKTIYLTDENNKLVGQIGLEDLVLKAPQVILASFMRPNVLVVKAEEDQDDVAQQMRHYQLTSAPVVGKNNSFIGAVTDQTLVEILEEEAGEDILRMSAMARIKHTYFETPFFRLLFERGAILFVLMIVESISSIIFKNYEALLASGLLAFTTMLISTGGNTSTQTSAVVVQGFASGELDNSNIKRFLRRETLMSFCLALVLGFGAFCRVFYIGKSTALVSLAVAASISAVVMVAVLLGSAVPFILKRIKLDPAYAAAPFLATGMDILGLLLYCVISQAILSFAC